MNVANNGPEAGWTFHSGVGNSVQGMSIDTWGQNGPGRRQHPLLLWLCRIVRWPERWLEPALGELPGYILEWQPRNSCAEQHDRHHLRSDCTRHGQPVRQRRGQRTRDQQRRWGLHVDADRRVQRRRRFRRNRDASDAGRLRRRRDHNLARLGLYQPACRDFHRRRRCEPVGDDGDAEHRRRAWRSWVRGRGHQRRRYPERACGRQYLGRRGHAAGGIWDRNGGPWGADAGRDGAR